MANMGVWINKLNSISNCNIPHNKKDTIETYATIIELGFDTVCWETYSSKELLKSLKKIETFIKKNHPCLFIFDPLTPDVHKGYFCDVNDMKPIVTWIADNKKQLSKFKYLVTTQINNHGEGFVGVAFSDGKGTLYCETLHIPEIKNTRDLSQPKQDFDHYLVHFSTGTFEPIMIDGYLLDKTKIRRIINSYAHHKGYFEFVYGRQAGKIGLYTTGYETGAFFAFPHDFYQSTASPREKLQWLLMKEGML